MLSLLGFDGGGWLSHLVLAIGDFNCPIYLGIQAHLYTRLIKLGPIDNEAFSGAGMP